MTDISRLETMRKMATANPDNALARFGFANELIKAQMWEDAARELSAYLEQYDDEGNGWLRYVDVLRTLERDNDARVAIARGTDAARRYGHGALVAEFESRLEELDE